MHFSRVIFIKIAVYLNTLFFTCNYITTHMVLSKIINYYIIMNDYITRSTYRWNLECQRADPWIHRVLHCDGMRTWIIRFGICSCSDRWLPVVLQLLDLGSRIYMHIFYRVLLSWCFCRSNIWKQNYKSI